MARGNCWLTTAWHESRFTAVLLCVCDPVPLLPTSRLPYAAAGHYAPWGHVSPGYARTLQRPGSHRGGIYHTIRQLEKHELPRHNSFHRIVQHFRAHKPQLEQGFQVCCPSCSRRWRSFTKTNKGYTTDELSSPGYLRACPGLLVHAALNVA